MLTGGKRALYETKGLHDSGQWMALTAGEETTILTMRMGR